MIRSVKDTSRKPGSCYTEAACDRCGKASEASRIHKTDRRKIWEAALAKALAEGWTQELATRQGKRQPYTVYELICPECRAKAGGGDTA